MNNFGLDKNYQQFNFNEISVADLQIISGGSGSGSCIDAYRNTGAAIGSSIGGFIGGAIGSAIGGAIGSAVCS